MSRPIRAGALCAALALHLFNPRFAHATVEVAIHGTVFDEAEQPIAAAEVLLHDVRGATVGKTTTAGDGKFSFANIVFGDYTVEASTPGRVDAHQHITVGSAEVGEVDLYCLNPKYVTRVLEEAPTAPLPPKTTASTVTLSREALKALPQGEDRPVTDVLATQPGFVLDAFGNVYARGNHANIQYQIDGIPIPDSVGQLFAQSLPVRLIQNLEIFTGGIPAEFGDRLAAVVNLTSRHGGADPEGAAQLRYGSFETVEPSATYARSFGRLGVFVGGSYLQSQRALDPPSVTPILHDDGRSGRAFLRLDLRASDRDRFELFAAYAYNRFQIPIDPTVAPLDPSQPSLMRPVDGYGNASPPFVPHDTDASETENELFVAGSWFHSFSPRAQLQVAPYYKLSLGALDGDASHALGALADPGSAASDVARRADHLGGVVNASVHLGNHLLKAGVSADYLAGRTEFTAYQRDDASPSGGIDEARTGRGIDSTSALEAGAYVEDRWDRSRFAWNVGLRVDLLHVVLPDGSSDDQVGASPRVGVTFAFLKQLVGHAFVGVNWQPPAPLDAGNAARVLGVVPPGTAVPYDLKPEWDLYGELGLDARPWKRLRLSAVGWGRYAWNQLDDTTIGATNLIANYNFQHGRAVGVEGRAELVLGYWLSAFANASWEIAQGQGIASAKFLFAPADLASTDWQTLDHAQTLTANLGVTLHEKGAFLTLLGSYGSGLRTGPLNQSTVPAHYRLDATLGYSFDQVPLKPRVAVDVINLFDARYAFRIANGFVGSSYAPPRSVFVRIAFPLDGGVR